MSINKELLESYKTSLPSKLDTIQKLSSTLQEALDQLRFVVHKLAGSSGTYGYMEASQLCKKMESKLLAHSADLNLTLFQNELKKRLENSDQK
jgi:HPt (histidine-containing phosphotransfer) domain-containing protein